MLPVPGDACFSFFCSLDRSACIFIGREHIGGFRGVKKSLKQKQMVSEVRREAIAQRSIGINGKGVKDVWETSNKKT